MSMHTRILKLGFVGILFLCLSLIGGLALPVLAILGVSAGLDNQYVFMVAYIIGLVIILYLLGYFWNRLKIIWKKPVP